MEAGAMAWSLLTKPSPSRAMLMARLHHASPASLMANARFSAEALKSSTLPQMGCRPLPNRSFNGVAELNVLGTGDPFCILVPLRAVHSAAREVNPLRTVASSTGQVLGSGWSLISCSTGTKQKCFCLSNGQINGPSQRNVEHGRPMKNSDIRKTAHLYQQQQGLHSANSNMTQQQQPAHPAGSNHHQQQQPTPSLGNQKMGQTSHMGSPPAGTYTPNPQQHGYVPPAGASSGAHVSGEQNPRNPSYANPNMSSTVSAGGTPPSPPRTSAAAEVIDKYLGPSTLKLEKQDDKAPPPPPPPPRRNYGSQGTQEKKSGKDLVAESAACAVIEKYLGPWPGFPPRDPKIDEYLDSLPENAACAAIDKYFGPYKPLFVFKKNEGDANNPPPPSRPPRNRMMSRARNRAWNASQQGASVDRPWTPPQQGPPSNAAQGGQAAQGVAVPSPQGSVPSQQPQPGMMNSQTMAPQQGASTMPTQGANMAAPHASGTGPPNSNSN